MPTASTGASGPKMRERQKDSFSAIFYGRYNQAFVPDPWFGLYRAVCMSLYSCPFYRFQDHMYVLPAPPAFYKPSRAISEFSEACAIHYDKESDRSYAITKHFSELVGFQFVPRPSRKSSGLSVGPKGADPDTVIQTSVRVGNQEYLVFLAFREDKNELNSTNSDATVQAALGYEKLITEVRSTLYSHSYSLLTFTQQAYTVIRNHSCCPAFLLSVVGPWLIVQGAIYTDKLIVQNLCDPKYIGRDKYLDLNHMWALQHMFTGLGAALRQLRQDNLDIATKLSLQAEQQKGPNIGLLAADPTNSAPRFFPVANVFGKFEVEYTEHIRRDAWGTTFIATVVGSGQKVVVKFVQQYGYDAHKLLAENGFAPEILYFGDIYPDVIDRPLRPLAVVMPYIDGVDATMGAMSEYQIQQLCSAVRLLHSKRLVHGDLCSPNVCIGSDGEVYVLDFDWAGPVGQV